MRAQVAFLVGWFLGVAFTLAAGGCSLTTYPPAPPPDGPGTCETACARDAELGCGLGPTCLQDCHDAEQAELEIGRRLPLGCMTAAATCEERDRCR